MNLAEHRSLRLFTFCALYVAQGIPWGFMAYTLPAYVAARGGDIGAVGGITAMTTLPYTLKIVWGPMVDAFPSRRFGRRRPWIVFAQGMMVTTVAAMIFIPDLTANITTLAWMIFIHTIFNAMQDVSVDALAVDLLPASERGLANGLMYGSKYLGGFLGAAGMSKLIAWFDLRTALVAQVSVLIAIMLLPILFREGPNPPPKRPFVTKAIADWFRRTFGDKSVFAVLSAGIRDRAIQTATLGFVVMLATNIGSATLVAAGNVLFTQQLGWTADDYVGLQGGLGLWVGFGGALLGGLLADRVGHRLLAAIGMLGLAGGYALWALLEPYWMNPNTYYATFWIEPFFQALMLVSLFAICMDITFPQIAAAQFAWYMAMSNVSSTIGSLIAGRVSAHLSYVQLWLLAAAVQAAFILVLPLMDLKAARSRDPRTQPA